MPYEIVTHFMPWRIVTLMKSEMKKKTCNKYILICSNLFFGPFKVEGTILGKIGPIQEKVLPIIACLIMMCKGGNLVF